MIYDLPTPATPALIDIPIIEINQQLREGLPWLQNAFGKCQRMTRANTTGKTIFYPAVHYGSQKEYLDLTPNETDKENYCFWEIDDPYNIETIPNQFHVIKANYSIIFWFNINKVLDAAENRNTELIKQQILDVFTANNTRSSRVDVTEIAEKFENVFKSYSYKEVQEQHITHPFAAIRISGNLRFEKQC